MRNGKKTAILAAAIDKKSSSKAGKGKKQEKVYVIYRPNTGQQVRRALLVTLMAILVTTCGNWSLLYVVNGTI